MWRAGLRATGQFDYPLLRQVAVVPPLVKGQSDDGNPELPVLMGCRAMQTNGPADFLPAFAMRLHPDDLAVDRLKSQLRKAADRRKTHQGLRVASALEPTQFSTPQKDDVAENEDRYEVAGMVVDGDGPLVVREKEFDTSSLSLAQALDEMELVGHDFFLYQDAETGRPSVVYRRKAYNYGVIHLNVH